MEGLLLGEGLYHAEDRRQKTEAASVERSDGTSRPRLMAHPETVVRELFVLLSSIFFFLDFRIRQY
jgi:hypothetical protein